MHLKYPIVLIEMPKTVIRKIDGAFLVISVTCREGLIVYSVHMLTAILLFTREGVKSKDLSETAGPPNYQEVSNTVLGWRSNFALRLIKGE